MSHEARLAAIHQAQRLMYPRRTLACDRPSSGPSARVWLAASRYAPLTLVLESWALITAGKMTNSQPRSAGPTLATIHRFRGTGTRWRMTSHCSTPSTPPNSKAPTVATSSATIPLRLITDRCSTSALIHETTATAVSTTTKATLLYRIHCQYRRADQLLDATFIYGASVERVTSGSPLDDQRAARQAFSTALKPCHPLG